MKGTLSSGAIHRASTTHLLPADPVLGSVTVEARAISPYKADRVQSPRLTQPLFDTPLLDTPQSVAIDGVHDDGMSSRTDIFNMEQVEVCKGTGSAHRPMVFSFTAFRAPVAR